MVELSALGQKKNPSGKYQHLIGQESCINCNAGRYSSSIGATSSSTCTECEAGSYSTKEGAVDSNYCTVCIDGFAFRDGSSPIDGNSCLDICPSGSFIEDERVCKSCERWVPILWITAYLSANTKQQKYENTKTQCKVSRPGWSAVLSLVHQRSTKRISNSMHRSLLSWLLYRFRPDVL